MSDDENSERRDRLTRSTLVGLSAIGLLLIGARVAWSWPSLQVLAGSLQLLGILMTALGVAAVWSLLELLADEASDAKRSIARSWAATRQRVWLWWLRRRGKTTPAYIVGSSAGVSGGGAILTVGHPSVDRDTISDRDWLVFLNDQLDLLREDLRTAQKRHSEELAERLAAEQDRLRTQMRHELQKATRQGWELVLAGLFWLAVGTIVGMCA